MILASVERVRTSSTTASANDIVQSVEPAGPPRRRLNLGFGMGSVLRFIRENRLRDAKESRVVLAVDVPNGWRPYAGATIRHLCRSPRSWNRRHCVLPRALTCDGSSVRSNRRRSRVLGPVHNWIVVI